MTTVATADYTPSPEAYLVGLFDVPDVKVEMQVNPGTEAYLVGLFEATRAISSKYICAALGSQVSKVNIVVQPEFWEYITEPESGKLGDTSAVVGKVEYFVEGTNTPEACNIQLVPGGSGVAPVPYPVNINVSSIAISGTVTKPNAIIVHVDGGYGFGTAKIDTKSLTTSFA
ncbi:hypothetical protein ACHHYP_07984 [Achlya hypogyna]|uniref:Uncharacterized protein n=1 Tax=Achlya hypogyna TaxID=1202772 RepID=A0A1V9YQ29_ACHHY|nr:hypothetical protein ACHHYP_07984 [Achlya hypogyna]